jgi:hypothetical protein
MKATHIQLNITGGSTIDEAIDEAFRATEHAEIVSFSFNGTKIALTKDDIKNDILKYWERAMFSDKWYKN